MTMTMTDILMESIAIPFICCIEDKFKEMTVSDLALHLNTV